MNDLIAKLEAAEEGGKLLDILIQRYLFEPSGAPLAQARDNAKPYTTSLDAALSLVPEQGEPTWTIRYGFDERQKSRVYDAEICFGPVGAGRRWASSNRRPSAALALCIAALRARQASHD